MSIEYRRQRVPFIKPIHGGLPVGARVELECIPYGDVQHSFLLEYTSAENTAIQIEVNLNGEGVDLRSSIAGQTSKEEWLPSFIPADKNINLSVHAQQNYFEITLNGRHLRDFDYQCSLDNVDKLAIRGEIGILCVRFVDFGQNLEPPRPGCENYFRYSSAGYPISSPAAPLVETNFNRNRKRNDIPINNIYVTSDPHETPTL